MPKIMTNVKVKPKTVVTGRYTTVPYPESITTLEQEVAQVLNLQVCTCDHDRCCHSRYVGRGEEQRLVVGAFSVGRCLAKDCKCGAFVFSFDNSSAEGKKRRQREKGLTKDYPPAEGEK